MKVFWVSDTGPCPEQEKELKRLHGDEIEIVPTPPQGADLRNLKGGKVYIRPSEAPKTALLAKLAGVSIGIISGRDVSE